MKELSLKQIKLLLKLKQKEIDALLVSKRVPMSDAVILATELKSINESIDIIEEKIKEINNIKQYD